MKIIQTLSIIGYILLSHVLYNAYKSYNELDCHDYTTNNGVWIGYIATKNGETRCFWVESYYPYRVRQGRLD